MKLLTKSLTTLLSVTIIGGFIFAVNSSFAQDPKTQEEYEKKLEDIVVKYFWEEYMKGRTPNPCIICNERIKFSSLLNKARSYGAEFIATGHYARIENSSGRYFLKKGESSSFIAVS